MRQFKYFATLLLLLSWSTELRSQKTEVGTWFGTATPLVCNVPVPPGCPPIIVMMPEFHADGTMVATDNGSFSDNHLMGQGNWAKKPANQGIEGTFMWLQGTPTTPPAFVGAFRVRLNGQLALTNADQMTGTIEPFFFPFVDPATGQIMLGADGFPSPDPLGGTGELPACTLPNFCLGRFQFLVRRIPTR
ncbi:MAG: hypothetical protein ACRD88_11325 [Terriglobia bacterium]